MFVTDECRDLLQQMDQTVHDEPYEDIIFKALPTEYERARNASCAKRDFELNGIRHVVSAMPRVGDG